MGNDIGSGLSFKAVCCDFRSTNLGSSVIVTRSTTGFDVITLQSPTLVECKQILKKLVNSESRILDWFVDM